MKIIAYYLPQYHPTKENNEWWGEGFTEWTNVGKAKPLYKGHYQPRVPKDLGYYDLRNNEIRIKQAEMADEAGVDAFCYWHYWFGNGKRLLESPFNDVLKSGSPKKQFCLGWANESWKAKVWSNDTKKDKLLIEQMYPGEIDYTNHFYALLDAFKDNRYLRYNNRPIFVIYKPLSFNDCHLFINIWNKLAVKEELSDGFHFIAYADYSYQIKKLFKIGFNAVNIVRISEYYYNKNLQKKILLPIIKYKFFNHPLVIKYKTAKKFFTGQEERLESVYPTIIPNWDHTPRSGKRGVVFDKSTPELFGEHVLDIFESIKHKQHNNQIVFLKSWNEWGEGNYMEPDIIFGKSYIDTLSKIKKQFIRNRQ